MMMQTRILCIGDSNTYGYDPRSFLGSRYPENVRWTGILAESGYDVVNFGQNGKFVPRPTEFSRISGLLQEKGTFSHILVMLGSNDILNGISAKETAEHMEVFLRFLKGMAEKAAVILIAPPVMQYGEWVDSASVIDESALLAERYREAAEKLNILFADSGRWNIKISYDGVHFLPEGHASFAAEIENLLKTAGI